MSKAAAPSGVMSARAGTRRRAADVERVRRKVEEVEAGELDSIRRVSMMGGMPCGFGTAAEADAVSAAWTKLCRESWVRRKKVLGRGRKLCL